MFGLTIAISVEGHYLRKRRERIQGQRESIWSSAETKELVLYFVFLAEIEPRPLRFEILIWRVLLFVSILLRTLEGHLIFHPNSLLSKRLIHSTHFFPEDLLVPLHLSSGPLLP